jgi:hypothetical protein
VIALTNKLGFANKNTHFIPNGIAFIPNGTNTVNSVDGEKNNSIINSK